MLRGFQRNEYPGSSVARRLGGFRGGVLPLWDWFWPQVLWFAHPFVLGWALAGGSRTARRRVPGYELEIGRVDSGLNRPVVLEQVRPAFQGRLADRD